MIKVQEGQKAPAFKGKDQNGETVSSTDLKGKKIGNTWRITQGGLDEFLTH